jgi:hypothetical protein
VDTLLKARSFLIQRLRETLTARSARCTLIDKADDGTLPAKLRADLSTDATSAFDVVRD